MDSKELRGLYEAYAEVYTPQEVDEGKVELDQERRSRMGRQIGKKVRSAEAEYSLSKDTMYPKGLRGAMEKGARKKVGQAQKIMGALKSAQKEEFDIFDVVLEFLQAEGFAETLEEAEWMMANVIDEEAIGIILGEGNPIARFLSNRKHRLRDTEKGHEDIMRRNKEYQTKGKGPGGYRNKGAGRVEKVREEYMDEAQEARNNPEKYEADQKKKSAPVRGEKTPMPPRGDKRREDFEKWYAKQMGR